METNQITTVTNVSLAWITANLVGSIDGFTICLECSEEALWCECSTDETCMDWDGMIAQKGEDYSLEDEFSEGIRNPVCLRFYDDRWTMGNGHHRLAYAMIKNHDSIKAVFSFSDDYMMSSSTGD